MKRQDKIALTILLLGVIIVFVGLSFWKCGSTTVLAVAAFAMATLNVVLKVPYKKVIKEIEGAIAAMIPAMLILLCVGMMVGAWMASGTIPYMMYLGLRFIEPGVFLPLVCLICTVMSVVAGTSWGTMATIGVAAMSVGAGLGVPAELTAAAVVVGGFFGDSLSPMSDSTVIVCSVTEVPLLQGIRQSLLSTGPAYIVSLIYFVFCGKNISKESISSDLFNQMVEALEQEFSFSALLLLPLILVMVLLILKKPILPVFVCGTAVAVIISIFVQKMDFSATLSALNSGYSAESTLELLNTMLTRGGFSSMYSTLGLLIAAAAFSGTLRAAGVMEMVLETVRKLAVGPKAMQLYVLFTHGAMFMMTGAYYVSYPLVGSVSKGLFEEYHVDRRVLSRLLLDTGTGMAPLIGWSVTGAYTATTLGVSTLAFAPHAIMCWLTVIFSVLLILAGVGIEKNTDNKLEEGFTL